jgi:ribosomal peptide maturation radical SAM protein 1
LTTGVTEFVDRVAAEIVDYSPKIVGFTSVFQQNFASLSVARRIREKNSSIKILFGGANCEGTMGTELVQAFQFLDFVISGEADLLIVPLVKGILAGEDLRKSKLLTQFIHSADAWPCIQTKLLSDLSEYTTPDFADYFEDLGRLEMSKTEFRTHIPMETSRGCWWGMKNHCTFCGLNGMTMSFRSRPAGAAIKEITELSKRHPQSKICFVDNIMDYKYYNTLLPALAEAKHGLNLFYEIKSNITKTQIIALKNAGVHHVQPGIESLSDDILKLMRKGVKAIQNVQLLKWSTEYDIKVDWNFLWGFPGEEPSEYDKMAKMMPLISHLQPPTRGSEIRIDRFSPNFTESGEHGFTQLEPYEAYYELYTGLSRQSVANIAYYFQAYWPGKDSVDEYTKKASEIIHRWKLHHAKSTLAFLESGNRVLIFDSRPMVFGKHVYCLDSLRSRVYLLCDKALTVSALVSQIPDAVATQIQGILSEFCEKGIMLRLGEEYLALAVSFERFLESRGKNVQDALDSVFAQCRRDLGNTTNG